MYGKTDWISTASGSERGRSVKPTCYRSWYWSALSSQHALHWFAICS